MELREGDLTKYEKGVGLGTYTLHFAKCNARINSMQTDKNTRTNKQLYNLADHLNLKKRICMMNKPVVEKQIQYFSITFIT